MELDGFTMVRANRSKYSGKRKGSGLVVFINSRWCHPGHVTIKQQICTPDTELLAVSLRPYYLPREFSHVLAVIVYIPPSTALSRACDVIHSSIPELQTAHPSTFIFILVNRDFNHVNASETLPDFKQHVTCSTRLNTTLDMLFANVKDTYRSTALPPLGGSDHNLVRARPAIMRLPTTTRTIPQWSEEVEEELRGCFGTTDWEMLKGAYGEDIDGLTVCITDYIRFCEETTVPTKKVWCFPNSKPWINGKIKALLKEKRRLFTTGDTEGAKAVQKEVKNIKKDWKLDWRPTTPRRCGGGLRK